MPWVELKPTRKTKETGILGDIESHLWDGHPYKEPDKVTWTHEGTHGVNSTLRNNANRGASVRSNGFYLLGDWGFTHEEPPFKLRDVAEKIPADMRGQVYKMYLVDQQRYWNDEPLYIFDELSAYLNGAKSGIELKMDERAEYSGARAIEFFGYGAIVYEMGGRKESLHSLLTFLSFELNYVVGCYPSLKAGYDKVLKRISEDIVLP